TQRVFLMRNVHDDAPVLLKVRWLLSYLRGPLTPAEISRLMAPRKQAAGTTASSPTAAAPAAAPAAPAAPAAAQPAAAAPAAQASGGAGAPPILPAGVEQSFVPVRGAAEGITYRPRVLGEAKLHFVDRASN